MTPDFNSPDSATVNVFMASEPGASHGDDSPTVVLPMQLVSLDDAGQTDVGQQRNHNEDEFVIQTSIKRLENPQGRSLQAHGLYVLCDGMGGHAAGEVASAKAANFIKQFFETHTWDKLPSEAMIREAILGANHDLYRANQESSSYGSGRMGTTLVMLLIHNTHVAIAHVGDSRIYRYTRKKGLELLTLDHELGQLEIQRGVDPEVAYAMPDAYQLTQALGPRDNNCVDPDITCLELNEDTLFLLCSDGLSDNDLLEESAETHIKPLLSSRKNLDQGMIELMELANECNGHDNITAIAIRAKVKPNMATLML
ncbi:serine/threonine phosphatase [Prochlorothrix hollandica]|uniref:serine/threonine phosphatase n=1 Tax=Prochlorothrix hollandica TaxID=1223 RepID=UPI00333EF06B